MTSETRYAEAVYEALEAPIFHAAGAAGAGGHPSVAREVGIVGPPASLFFDFLDDLPGLLPSLRVESSILDQPLGEDGYPSPDRIDGAAKVDCGFGELFVGLRRLEIEEAAGDFLGLFLDVLDQIGQQHCPCRGDQLDQIVVVVAHASGSFLELRTEAAEVTEILVNSPEHGFLHTFAERGVGQFFPATAAGLRLRPWRLGSVVRAIKAAPAKAW